jgi:hypothetical protein
VAKKSTVVSLRYPYTGDTYTAEGRHRIRVEHGNQWGYFDDCGRWMEGPLRTADPTFCRYLSSAWIVEDDPVKWGVALNGPPSKAKANGKAKTKAAPKAKPRRR